MVVLDDNFALGCGPETDYPYTYISMYARTNEVLNPITFVLAYLTVPHSPTHKTPQVVRHTLQLARQTSEFNTLNFLTVLGRRVIFRDIFQQQKLVSRDEKEGTSLHLSSSSMPLTVIYLLIHSLLKDKRAIKTNEMGRSRSTYEEKKGYRVLVGKPKERAHYADIGVDGSTILK
jgi:hypothetical protein